MDYGRIYDALVTRGQARTVQGYSERHHILPRCMGGGDEPANIVRLTPEEHFLAHQLLIKMHPEHPKLVFALLAMTMNVTGQRMGNKLFGWMRRRMGEEISRLKTGVPRDREMMEAIWAGNRGRSMLPHQVEKMRVGLAGKPKSEAHRAALSEALSGRTSPMKGRKQSEETKAKQRAAALARKHTAETRDKIKANLAAMTPEQRSARAHKAWATKRAKLKEPE